MTAAAVRVEHGDWRDRAACMSADGEAWYPERGEPTVIVKRICGSCPVRVDCLTEAIDAHETWGVWGGLAWPERRQLARFARGICRVHLRPWVAAALVNSIEGMTEVREWCQMKPPEDLCPEHTRIWLAWQNHRYDSVGRPLDWPGVMIADARTPPEKRRADWNAKNAEQMKLTEDICRSGRSPQCGPDQNARS